MTAIFGQLSRINKQATYEILECDMDKNQIKTKETWGHDHIQSQTLYTFDSTHKILSMES